METARRSLFAATLALLVLTGAAQSARELAAAFAAVPLPRGLGPEAAALSLRGKLGRSQPVYLDLATIKAFPAWSFTSLDPWDGKEHSFTGVLLAPLLERLGIAPEAASLTVSARNSYAAAIRRQDYERYGYILAYAIDGKPFGEDPVTKKRGPLAIAIDFGSHKELAPDIYKHQLVWQVVDILVQ